MRTVRRSCMQLLVCVLMVLELCLSASWILPTGTLSTTTQLGNIFRLHIVCIVLINHHPTNSACHHVRCYLNLELLRCVPVNIYSLSGGSKVPISVYIVRVSKPHLHPLSGGSKFQLLFSS